MQGKGRHQPSHLKKLDWSHSYPCPSGKLILQRTAIRSLPLGIYRGLQNWFSERSHPLKTSHVRNMPLAESHRTVISAYLKGELQDSHIACCGILHDLQQLKACISSFKKGWPNHWHLVIDLSAPEGRSVNDRTCSTFP